MTRRGGETSLPRGLRDPKELAKLPQEEQQWQQLWTEVDNLLRSAAAPKSN
jgi:hypothetical protein